ERNGAINQRTQARVDVQALLADLLKAVRLAKSLAVPYEKPLEGLLGRLLRMEYDVSCQRGRRRQLEIGGTEVGSGFPKPGAGFRYQRRVMRHRASSPRARRRPAAKLEPGDGSRSFAESKRGRRDR